VKLWGKVAGVYNDYYIAQGYGDNHVEERKTFFSTTHCVSWSQMPDLYDAWEKSAKRVLTRFTGTPDKEYQVVEPGPSPADPPLDLPEVVKKSRSVETTEDSSVVTTTLTEAVRLAALVKQIDHDCAVAPYGAYTKTGSGEIVAKRFFEGLSHADAGKLQSYLHFRTPEKKRTALERAQQDKTLDFFDPLTDDIPEGSWSLQYERGGAVAVLKSLVWPGFSFFHCPGTTMFGYSYSGLGQKNGDLAFGLPATGGSADE
jgi:radial spoke head protein 9